MCTYTLLSRGFSSSLKPMNQVQSRKQLPLRMEKMLLIFLLERRLLQKGESTGLILLVYLLLETSWVKFHDFTSIFSWTTFHQVMALERFFWFNPFCRQAFTSSPENKSGIICLGNASPIRASISFAFHDFHQRSIVLLYNMLVNMVHYCSSAQFNKSEMSS